MKTPRVVCAAIRNKRTGLILCGPRHFDKTMVMLIRQSIVNPKFNESWADADQGFVDQFGNFLGRREAYVIAEKNGQLLDERPSHTKGCLYSEDLY